MPRFNIFNQASATDLGTYEADTSAAALDAMAKAAGYLDAAHMREMTGEDPDLIVTEVAARVLLKRGAIVTLKPEFREPGDDGRKFLVNADETQAGMRLVPLGDPMAAVHIVTRSMVDQIEPEQEDRTAAFKMMRKAAGTQEEIAEYLGIALRTLKGWEAGEYRVNPSAYKLIAQGSIKAGQ